MPRAAPIVGLVLLLAGCASGGGADGPAPLRARDFAPAQIRQPLILVRLTLGDVELGERDRAAVPGEYEGALLEGLNRRAVLARDVRVLGAREAGFDERRALARAREVGADHAILVDVRVAREVVTACAETRRPLRGSAIVWKQDVAVLRASDGSARLRLVGSPGMSALDTDVDCDKPRESRRRSRADIVDDAVDRLLGRLFGG